MTIEKDPGDALSKLRRNPMVQSAQEIGIPTRYRRISQPELQAFDSPSQELLSLYSGAISGTNKERRTSSRAIIKLATEGTENDLLDVMNSVAIGIILHHKPQVLDQANIAHFKGNLSSQTRANARKLMADVSEALSVDSRNYLFDMRRISTKSKAQLAKDLFQDLVPIVSAQELTKFAPGFYGIYGAVATGGELVGTRAASAAVEITTPELERLRELSAMDVSTISSDGFNLAIKALLHLHRDPHNLSAEILSKFFNGTSEEEMQRCLNLLNDCLQSKSPLLRNKSLRLVTGYVPQPENFALSLEGWYSRLLSHLDRFVDQGEPQTEIERGIEKMILATREVERGASWLLTLFYGALEKEFITYNERIDRIRNLASTDVSNPAIQLLIKTARENRYNTINPESFMELFDKKQPLGYFLENLEGNWQELQDITREQIWPSFITAQMAKIWPSENELDILEFTGQHPAAVLGFKGIQFFTKGYEPPEVGILFTFDHTEEVLQGSLDKDGHLIKLSVDTEQVPQLHAFLEHIAVGSFQELVTIASKSIMPKGESRVSRQNTIKDSESKESANQAPSLPRWEVTYITVSDHITRSRTTDEVIEGARQRERLPRQISQKVVPLPYAQRYRYFRDEAQKARQNGEGDERVRVFEGQAAENLALVKKPSAGKLVNLPSEFALDTTADGKYLDTWRREHLRPKPKEGEELSLPDVFERHFKAAPIAMTLHLSTWFTQPASKI